MNRKINLIYNQYWHYRIKESNKKENNSSPNEIFDTASPVLKGGDRILDVGCGKAHLLCEFKKLLPDAEIVGFDISKHGIADAPEEVREYLRIHRAQDPYPFEDNYFDLVLTLGCFHNLRIFELETAIKEVERVGKNKYIMLESYRSELEQFNLQCWALTCESFFDEEECVWVYKHFGYTGDYEFIYFE